MCIHLCSLSVPKEAPSASKISYLISYCFTGLTWNHLPWALSFIHPAHRGKHSIEWCSWWHPSFRESPKCHTYWSGRGKGHIWLENFRIFKDDFKDQGLPAPFFIIGDHYRAKPFITYLENQFLRWNLNFLKEHFRRKSIFKYWVVEIVQNLLWS